MGTIKKALLVDDVEAHQLFFQVILTELGIKDVLTAPDGETALALTAKQPVHLVIAAWEMRGMPGTMLVQKLRTGKRRHISYLIYSKAMTEADLRLTRELGLENVMTLPLDKAMARQTIHNLIDAEAKLSPEETRLRKIEAILAASRPTEALSLFDDRLKKPGRLFVRAQTALGNAWLLTNQLQKAEECFKTALATDPAAFEAQTQLATVYSKMGRHDEAIATLTRLSDSSPKNLTALVTLGSSYVEADRHDEAKKVFDRLDLLDPDNREVKDERGKLAFKEGDLPLAAKLLAETQNGDGLARHFNNLAIALTHKQEFDKAIATYENAIRLLGANAGLAALRYNLGLALAKKGALQRSFLELVASYKSDPTFEKAYAALARVGKQMTEQGLEYDKALVREVNQLRRSLADKTQAAAPATPKTGAA